MSGEDVGVLGWRFRHRTPAAPQHRCHFPRVPAPTLFLPAHSSLAEDPLGKGEVHAPPWVPRPRSGCGTTGHPFHQQERTGW